MGVWPARTTSRVTVEAKSALTRYRLLRKASTILMLMAPAAAQGLAPAPDVVLIEEVARFWTHAARLGSTVATIRCLARQVADEGGARCKSPSPETCRSQVIHEADTVISVAPSPAARRTGRRWC